MRLHGWLSSCLAASSLAAAAAVAQPPAGLDASGAWALGLAGQVDENSSDSLLANFNWAVAPKTWLTFAAGRSTSPAELAGIQVDTLVAGVDHRFDAVGFIFEAESWGDSGVLETADLSAALYFSLERVRVDFAFQTRDIEIPFTLTGPLGGTFQRTAEVSADNFRVSARVALAERWRLYLGASEHDYERDLALLPRIDRLNLLSTSTMTLAYSFIDHERSLGVEHDLGRKMLNVRYVTDRSAIDGSRYETLDAALLLPIAPRMDLEINLGHGRSELTKAATYGGLLLVIYGG